MRWEEGCLASAAVTVAPAAVTVVHVACAGQCSAAVDKYVGVAVRVVTGDVTTGGLEGVRGKQIGAG